MNEDPSLLKLLSEIANIFIAVATLALAFYVFVYQRQKDKINDKVQWFRTLIIEPNQDKIYGFYNNVISVTEEFHDNQYTNIDKIQKMDELKRIFNIFRKEFVVLLEAFDNDLYVDIKYHIDTLLDRLTNNIFSDNLNLNDDVEFDAHINHIILMSKNYVIARIARYNG